VQLAKVYGADVTGVDAAGKLDMLRSIGADRVLDYTREDFTRSGERYDVILDIAGNHPWPDIRRAITPEGTFVLIGHDHYGGSGHPWFGSLGRFAKLVVISPFVNQLHPFRGVKDPGDRLVVMKELIEAGKVTPVIDRTFPLSGVPEVSATWNRGKPEGSSSSPSETDDTPSSSARSSPCALFGPSRRLPVVRGTSADETQRAQNAELEPDSICGRAGRHRVSRQVGKLVADDRCER
jgi:Zinc-binding dehydrogenase